MSAWRGTSVLRRRSIIGLTALALVVTMHGQASAALPAERADAQVQPRPAPHQERSVPVTAMAPLDPLPDQAMVQSVKKTPAVSWPVSGVGSQAVRASGPVRVETLGRKGDALLVRLTRTDGAKGGTVPLQVDYSAYRDAYGGDWANRLRVFQLPGGNELPTRNDGSGRLTADVPAAGLYAVQAAADGGTGDFRATSTAPSVTWSVGSQSGDFNWSSALNAPPSTGGPQPDVALAYSSGSVDGRTGSTNNQTSWAGEGFEVAPGGAVERKYKSCAADKKDGNNANRDTGDLCWATDNATFTLNGRGGELVKDDATGAWRPRGDDGSKVEQLSRPGSNGDNNGEYWKITTKDGTQYFFGYNRLPGWVTGKPVTNSVWTVPVYGNHVGEPCRQAAYADSWCQQGYRFNLDYVVDRHGNTMSFFYDVETNNYARNVTATTVSSYVRAGNVARIEYGQTDGQVYTTPAVARVLFTAAERCIPGSACTMTQPATYPDTPLDRRCTSTTNCDNKFSPAFFTAKRLAKVTTQVWRGTAFADVGSWTFRHEFADPGDTTSPRLWLEGVTQAGHVGSAQALPEMNFDGIRLANRVDPAGDAQPVMNWWRISAVNYGTGGRLAISYSGQDCRPGDTPQPDTNGRRCHPMKWTPAGEPERTDWFHKYVVTKVEEHDATNPLEPIVTTVEYPRPPAWHHDEEDGLVEINRKTWSQWRGYDLVRVTKGRAGGTQSVTERTFLRGMDGDRKADGTVKDVHVADSTGATVEDLAPLAGQELEQVTKNGGTVTERARTDQWVSAPTATRVRPWGTTKAFQVQEKSAQQVIAVEGGTRTSSAQNTFAADGTLTSSTDLKDVANPNDDLCTRWEYAGNPAAGIDDLPARKQVVAKACDKAWTNADVVADERNYYDGSTTPGGTPTRGDVTKRDRLSGFDAGGQPVYETAETASYDANGRVTSTSDPLNRTSTMTYTPATGPVTAKEVRLQNGNTTKTELEPAWGQEVAIVDAAGRRTDAARDALGRTTKVWMPGRARTATPNVEYGYGLTSAGTNLTTTSTLQTDGSVEKVFEFSDGMMRKRQTQKPGAGGTGRIIEDVLYDSRGLKSKEYGPYFNEAAPVPEVVTAGDELDLPTVKLTTYDGADRPLTEEFRSYGVQKWATRHTVTGDRQSIDPPAGEQPTTRVTDVSGRLTELRQYTGSAPTGTFDKTAYSYTPAGLLKSVTDPAGNVWSFDYDVRGNKIRETNPDKGTATYTYNAAGQLVTSTDSLGVTLETEYDAVGRRTGLYERTATGRTKRSEWVYDTIAKGSLTSSTRWIGGQAYTVRTTGYDTGGRPTGTQVQLPGTEGALAGTYSAGNTWRPDGKPLTTTLPAIGGLPAETLTHGYNANGMPTSLSSATTSYVRASGYLPYGELETMALGLTGGKQVDVWQDFEPGTRRLQKVTTLRDTAPNVVSDVAYNYDEAGNITRIADTPDTATGEATDTQCFGYDHLRRLTAAWTPSSGNCATPPSASGLGGPAPYWHSWTFDLTGNRKTATKVGPGGTTTSTYDYPAAGQAKPHAVQKVTTTSPAGSKVDTYGYDAAGNTRTRSLAGAGETFAWDPEGQLSSVTKAGQTTSYIYDADGNRLLRKDASGTTLYFGQTELLLKPGGALAGTRYYQHGDKTVAVRVGNPTNKVTWLVADHHGTSNVAIDADTQAFQRRRTDPYGEARGPQPPAWPGQRGFVGGTNDDSTGLVHLGAREYDPTIGRFISVDPVADFSDPQQLNGYAYANNSPTTFTDPDGKRYVTTTVQVLERRARWITQRITELHREQQRYVKWVFAGFKAVSTAFGWGGVFGAIAALVAVFIRVVVAIWVIKKIVRTIHKLHYELVRVVKKITRWVGDDRASEFKAMVRRTAQMLQEARQAATNLLRSIADHVASMSSGVQMAKQGGPLSLNGKPYDPDDYSDELPEQPGWYKALGWLASLGAGGAAGKACSKLDKSGAASGICGAAGLATPQGIFDGVWDLFNSSPREVAEGKEYAKQRKRHLETCHTYNGCTVGPTRPLPG